MSDQTNQSATKGWNPDFERRLLTLLLRDRVNQSFTRTGTLPGDGGIALVGQKQLGVLWEILFDYILSKLSQSERKRVLDQTPVFQSFLAESSPSTPDHDQGDIILLVLHPSSDRDTIISCSTRMTNIRTMIQPGYEVLSCVIEDRAKTKPIQLNDSRVNIPENLEAALKQLRDPEQPRELWMDVLCAGESEPQIELIKQIYDRAQRVTVWLGTGSATSRIALAFVEHFRELPNDRQRLLVSWLWNYPDANLSDYEPGKLELIWAWHYKPPDVRPAVGFYYPLHKVPVRDEHSRVQIRQIFRSITAGQMSAMILELMRRTWWNRAWLLQKLLSNREVQIRCGQEVARLESFTELFDMVLEVGLGNKVLSPTYPTKEIRSMLLYYHNHATLAMKYGYRGTGILVSRPFQVPPVRPAVMDHIMMQMPCNPWGGSRKTGTNVRNEETYIIEAFAWSIGRILEQSDGEVNGILATAKIAGNLGLILSELSVRVSSGCIRRIRGNMLQAFAKGGANFPLPGERLRDGSVFGDQKDARKIMEIQRKLRLVSPGETLEGLLERLRKQELDRSAAKSLSVTGLSITTATLCDDEDVRCWLRILRALSLKPLSETHQRNVRSNPPDPEAQPKKLNRMHTEVSTEVQDAKDKDWAEKMLKYTEKTISEQASTTSGITKHSNASSIHKEERSNLETSSYEPLNSDLREIRLLILRPCETNDSDIYADLLTVSLLALDGLGINRYPYVALSYMWGEDGPLEEKKKICLDGKMKFVTGNLFSALQRLRDPRMPLLLWVDALCIDQSNICEKNKQIPLMSTIYQKAGHVFVWLGKEEPYFWKIMLSLALYDYEMDLRRYAADPKLQERIRDARDLVRSTAQSAGPLDELWLRPYWSRVWIVQEIILAQNVTVCCGPYIASWEAYKSVSTYYGVNSSPVDIFYAGQNVPPPARLAEIQARRVAAVHDDSGISLLDTLMLGRTRFATNPLDYIYAFLPIWDLEASKLVPDYNKSLMSASIDAFRCVVNEEGNLDILSACRQYRSRAEFENAMTEPWPTCGWRNRAFGRFSGDGLHLILNGFTFETINYVSDQEWPDSMEQHCVSYLNQFQEGHPYDTERALHVALAETTFLSQCTFPSGTLLMPYNEDWLIRHAELFLGFSFDGTDRIEKPIREDRGSLSDKKELMEAFVSFQRDDRGEIREIIQQCDSTDTIGDEFLTITGERVAFSALTDDKLVEISRDSVNQLNASISTSTHPSRFFVTKQGCIGRGPLPIQKGDQVCILFGAKLPFILREISPDVYVILGEAYVHGIMKGEAVRDHAVQDHIGSRKFIIR
ncbi:hypothetical protein G7Y89_g13780 [Cudoniella acicularis]|uniref:Heterokaryon incompatibility domain-containing protein n=1 Tax=Cudoniella acicularis TaxID=354080 RepID=A0A8H4R7W3_9HELO|nr:hypothetical protein G7Y89_g13780 [Cudoniella acicularis]